MATKAKAKPASPKREPREQMGEAFVEIFDASFLREWMESIKSMSAGVWGSGSCPECGTQRKVRAEVPDIKGQITAVTALIEQVWGRPGTAAMDQQGTTIIVERPSR